MHASMCNSTAYTLDSTKVFIDFILNLFNTTTKKSDHHLWKYTQKHEDKFIHTKTSEFLGQFGYTCCLQASYLPLQILRYYVHFINRNSFLFSWNKIDKKTLPTTFRAVASYLRARGATAKKELWWLRNARSYGYCSKNEEIFAHSFSKLICERARSAWKRHCQLQVF